jgi:hypothetical protein
VVRWVTQSEPVAINNFWNTTVMPVKFRWQLVSIIAGNVATLVLWYVHQRWFYVLKG